MNDQAELTDEEIIVAVRTKDKERYAEIIRRYSTKLYSYARYLVRDGQDAQDVVQQTFIKAYVNLNGFDTKKKFSSWIYRIAHNCAMSMLGKEKNTTELDSYDDLKSTVDLEDDLIKKELVSKTHACLSQIPVLYREPLSLYYLDEKSYEDISDIMRIPVSTVGVRIRRAKAIMHTICQKI